MDVWDDGRSGRAGRIAGNLVLAHLERTERPVTKVKGTVFETAKVVLIGRVCSSSEYLSGDLLHWANVSWDQHRDVADEAKSRGKRLEYLFITASSDPAAVRFWRVAGETIAAHMTDRDKKLRGETCALHIIEVHGKHMIGRHDVTGLHGEISVGAAGASELREAIGARTAEAPRGLAAGSNAAPGCTASGYNIPLSGGRVAQLTVPVPIAPADLDRLKGWIDLMSDILTDETEAAREAEGKWLREQVAAGVEQARQGKLVPGEKVFDRILRRGKAARGVAR